MRKGEMGKIFGIALVCVMLGAMVPLGGFSSQRQALAQEPNTWYVDDDKQDYPAADFTKIQDAINAASGSGSTYVGGIISSNTTWTAADSPYIVTANILIENGATLTIEPSVVIKFNANKMLQVEGELIAMGTDAEPIAFTSNHPSPTPGDWAGIEFTDSSVDASYEAENYLSGSIMQYCTIQYGGGGSPALKIESASPFIDNCVIKNNSSPGIYITGGSSKITNSTITNNSVSSSANIYGGGIYASGDGITISGNTMTDNTISAVSSWFSERKAYGGGIYVSGTATINDNIIANNSAVAVGRYSHADAYGGGIYAIGTVIISGNAITNNSAPGSERYGGGIFASGIGIISNNIIIGNSVSGGTATGWTRAYGGGIYASGDEMTINDNSISHNLALNDYGYGCGGGIYIVGNGPNINGNSITNNEVSTEDGYHAERFAARGAGIYASGTITICDNDITGNSALETSYDSGGAYGGGIYASSAVTISDNKIANNFALDEGGGICGGGVISHNSIIYNSAAKGGGIYGSAIITNNTISGNTISQGQDKGGGIHVSGQPSINYNNIHSNTPYDIYNSNSKGSPDLDATNNWWGTTDEAEIQAHIYDWFDDSSLGLVNYIPYLTSPADTPPTVASTLPKDGATNVRVDIVITVTFSEAMDSSTVTTGSFTLAGSAVSGTIAYDSDTYTVTFTPDADLEYNHEYTATLSTAITDLAGNPLANSHTWSFTTGSPQNHPPVASSLSLTGQPKIMCPNTGYTVAAAYHDPDGADDLKYCYLRLDHPEKPLTMMWNQATDEFWTYAGEEGENYLTVSGWSIPMADTGYEINWTFEINEHWPEAENSINFGVLAMDDGDLTSGWDYDNSNASFVKPPTCVIELREQGTTSQIDKVDVGQFFDIYVGDSTDDTGIREVCFSSDDAQDDTPTGEWTEWYDWNISSGDWNAAAKTKAWSFATGGPKEVWAEVKDSAGQTDAEAANIKTSYAPNPCGYRFKNRGVVFVTGDSKCEVFDDVFGPSNVTRKKKAKVFDKWCTGGTCYGMSASSLTEYACPDYDSFLEDREEYTLYEMNKDGEDPHELWWMLRNWDGRGNLNAKPLLKHLLKFQLSQCGKTGYLYKNSSLDELLQRNFHDEMYVMGIGYYDADGIPHGHALIPYHVDGAKIYVYDPNKPNSSDCWVDISLENYTWGWKYNISWLKTWPPEDAREAYIILIPLQEVCEIAVLKPSWYTTGEASFLLTDSQGRKTGFSNGFLLREIPGVSLNPILNALPDEDYQSPQQVFYLDEDIKLIALAEGTNGGAYSLTKFGSGYFGDFSSSFNDDGEIHTITLSSDEAGLRFSGEGELEKTTLHQSTEQATYDITLHKNIEGTGQTVSATDIPVPVTPDAAHNYTIDWEAIVEGEPGVTIEKDSDGDGEFEETIVTSQPNTPGSPSPSNGAPSVSTDTQLSWTGGDPDAEDIVTYAVYFGTNSTPPLKETIGPYAADQTSISYEPGTLSYNTTYYWQIVARDNHGVVKEGPVWEFTTVVSSYDIALTAGWNLVSLPLIPDDADINEIISAENLASGNMDNVDLVYYFDTATETWLWWNGSPGSTLTTMEDGLGYWIGMSGPDTLTVYGTQVGEPPPEYDVIAEWNMIGFTSTASMAPEVYLASVAGDYTLLYGWDAVDGLWLWWNGAPASTLTTMEPGDGYWIDMNNPGTITPP